MASTDLARPNLLVIVSDDQGPWALGCAGNDELQTPTLDQLAEEGMRLDRFFCASPVCSPARASLLTGRMPSAHGVHDWIRGEAYGVVDERDIDYLEGLTTTPEVLADSGWTCGYSGKWHLGTGREPAAGVGFWYAHRTGDGPYVGAPVWRESEPRHLTEAITEEALSFLDGPGAAGEPFYLAVNYTAPHSPWVGQHPQRWLDLYADCDFVSCPQEPPHPWFSWEPGPVAEAMRDPRPSLQGYFASISAMDAGVAQLLARLDAGGLRESTIVVFTSDNGVQLRALRHLGQGQRDLAAEPVGELGASAGDHPLAGTGPGRGGQRRPGQRVRPASHAAGARRPRTARGSVRGRAERGCPGARKASWRAAGDRVRLRRVRRDADGAQ